MKSLEQLLGLPDEAEITREEGALLDEHWKAVRIADQLIMLAELADLLAWSRSANLSRQRQIRQEIESLHAALAKYGD